MTKKLEVLLLSDVQGLPTHRVYRGPLEIMVSPQPLHKSPEESYFIFLVVESLPQYVSIGMRGTIYKTDVIEKTSETFASIWSNDFALELGGAKLGLASVELLDAEMPFSIRVPYGHQMYRILSQEAVSISPVKTFGWVTHLANNPYGTPLNTWGLEAHGFLFSN